MLKINGKKALASLLALLCAGSMSACGGTTTPSIPVSSDSPSSSESTPQSTGLTGELNIFVHLGNIDAVPVVERMQQENPNLKIQLDTASGTQYETLLKTKLASGEAPDIMTVWPGSRTSDYAEKGYLEPINDSSFVSRIPATINEEFSFNNNLYAMCFTVGGEGLFCNMDILKANGLSVPKNFDEFVAVCETLKKNGIQPITSGYKDDWVIMRYTNSAFASLGYGRTPTFDADLESGKIDYSSAGWKDTFDRYKTLLDAKYFGENILSTDSTQAIADFATGKAAMMIHTGTSIKTIRDTSPEMDIVFTATPVNAANEELYGMWKSGMGLAISSTSKNKEAANRFLELWCDKELNEKTYAERGEATVLVDVPSSGLDKAIVAFREEFVNTGKFALGAHDRWPAGMSNNWKKKLQEFVGGQISTDQMLQWMNDEYAKMTK